VQKYEMLRPLIASWIEEAIASPANAMVNLYSFSRIAERAAPSEVAQMV
jgi:hypothetical protein